MSETGVTAIFAEENISPYARRRDAAVAARVPLRLAARLTIHPPDVVRKADGGVYTVFTPYSRAWKAPPPPCRVDLLAPPGLAPARLVAPPADLASLPIPDSPDLPASVPFPPGRPSGPPPRHPSSVARPPSSVHRDADDRNRMDLDGTSRLSPYLRFGMISVTVRRAALEAIDAAPAADARRGAETWLNELIWREFYTAILYHFPTSAGGFRPIARDPLGERSGAVRGLV